MRQLIQNFVGLFGYELHHKRTYHPIDPFVVQRQLIDRPQPVIFDIGAHVGRVTQVYRKLFPDALIYAFEPFPDSVARLREHTSQDQRIMVYATAIADRETIVAMNCNESSMTHSLLTTDKRGSYYWGNGVLETESQVDVTVTTIDSFCSQNSIKMIDIIKLDIQGAEYAALLGAQSTLKCQRANLLYLELLLAPTYAEQHHLHEYLQLLHSLGYTLLNFYNPIHHADRIIQADAIFVSNTLLSRREALRYAK